MTFQIGTALETRKVAQFQPPGQQPASTAVPARRVVDPKQPGFGIRVTELTIEDGQLTIALLDRLSFGSTPIAQQRVWLADARAVLTPEQQARFMVISAARQKLDTSKADARKFGWLAAGIGSAITLGATCFAPDGGTFAVIAVLGAALTGVAVRLSHDNLIMYAYRRKSAMTYALTQSPPQAIEVPKVAWSPTQPEKAE